MRTPRFRSATLALVPILVLCVACSDPDSGSTAAPTSTGAGATGSPSAADFDPASLAAVPEIEALVPDAVKDRGILRVGADTSYAPGEFLASDGHTPIGYDVDLSVALAHLMGLTGAETTTSDLPAIVPALGTKYDIGASSYTITPEREEQANLVSYVSVGSKYAVRAGNPTGFDPADPCGATLGVQNGTTQYDIVQRLAQDCLDQGKATLTIMPLDLQTDVSTKVIGGQYDATVADTTVLAYTIQQANGALEFVGDEFDPTPQGIAVAKDDEQLATAVQAGLQYLMDTGDLKAILSAYGAQDVALTTSEINPDVTE